MKKHLGFSGLAVLCYGFSLFLIVIFHNKIPHLGLTSEFLKNSNFDLYVKNKNLLTEKPYVAMAFGSIYYGLLIFLELGNMYLEKKRRKSFRLKSKSLQKEKSVEPTNLTITK